MLPTAAKPSSTLSYRTIFKTWWPLAFSWVLMSAELPALSAVMARLANPEINLAAYSGVIWPVALIIEAPIIMLLAASTALSRDWASYQKLNKFMLISGAVLTGVHAVVTFTPLYYVVVTKIMSVPEAIIEPGRVGLAIMLPWTWAIAYRRFNQGVLIRFGHSNAIGTGTMLRLAVAGVILMLGYWHKGFAGVVVGATAQALAVIAEAIYTSVKVRPVIQYQLKPAAPVETLTWKKFINFYTPLALTSFITLLWQPLGSAAMSRMPLPIESLATWPALAGLVAILRSSGYAFNEVTVALLDKPGSLQSMRKATGFLSGAIGLTHLVLVVTPLASLWFFNISALDPALARMGWQAFWLALPLSAMTVLQSWFQGAILVSHKTRAVSESVTIMLVTLLIVYGIGVRLQTQPGLFFAIGGLMVANVAQMSWLWWRSRPVMRALNERDMKPAGIVNPAVD